MKQRTFQRITVAALIAQTGIVITGGVVRLSKSGLGCPTWPRCSGDSLLPGSSNPHPSLNQAIEYTNRTLAGVVMAVGILCVIGAYRTQADPKTKLLAWAQPIGVLAQIVLGGVTVLVDLNPIAVGSHFMLSMAILAMTWLLYARVSVRAVDVIAAPPAYVCWMRNALITVVALLLVIGTIVTGSGPHAGDDKAPRYHFSIGAVTQLHADFVWITFGLTLTLLGIFGAGGTAPRAFRAARDLLIIELAQGVIGYVQYALGVPAVLVGFHIFGACLVWLATVRLVTTVRLGITQPASEEPMAATNVSTVPGASVRKSDGSVTSSSISIGSPLSDGTTSTRA